MKKLWIKVSDWFKSVGAWIRGAQKKVDDAIIKYAPIGVDIVQAVKTFNESPTADAIESMCKLLKGKYGTAMAAIIPNLRVFLNRWLPYVLETLNVSSAIAEVTTLEEKLKVFSEELSKMNIDQKSSTYTELAAKIAEIAKDGHVSFAEIADFVKAVKEVYEKKENKLTD